MKEAFGYIELDAEVVQSAAIAMKAEIIVQRNVMLDEQIDEVMTRKKPSRIALWFAGEDKHEIESADTREEAIKILKKYGKYSWSTVYELVMRHREAGYGIADTLIRTTETVLSNQTKSGRLIMIDLTTADMLTKYFD